MMHSSKRRLLNAGVISAALALAAGIGYARYRTTDSAAAQSKTADAAALESCCDPATLSVAALTTSTTSMSAMATGDAGSANAELSAAPAPRAGITAIVPSAEAEAEAKDASANLAPYYQGGRGRGGARGIYKSQVAPTWFDNNSKFWYRNALRGGKSEFILVDAEKGTRKPAFDHAKLAAALTKAADSTTNGETLPFSDIAFTQGDKAVTFSAYGKTWQCDLGTYSVTAGTSPTQVSMRMPPPNQLPTDLELARQASIWGGGAMPEYDLLARTAAELKASPYFEGDRNAAEVSNDLSTNENLNPSPYAQQQRGGGRRGGGRRGAGAGAGAGATTGTLARGANAFLQGGGQGGGGRRGGGGFGRGNQNYTEDSPLNTSDGKWSAFVKDNNVYVKPTAGGEALQMSEDGMTSNSYGRLMWSPDDKALIAWRIQPEVPNPVYIVHHAPGKPGSTRPDLSYGPATLETRNYPQAGDKFAIDELNVFDPATGKHTKPKTDLVDMFERNNNIRWNKDGIHFTYEHQDRGHTRFRIIEVNSHDGTVRNIIDENCTLPDSKEKFVWTMNVDGFTVPGGAGVPVLAYLDDTDQILYTSEMDGWRHIYLIDAKTGKKTLVTKGEFPLRGVQLIDTQAKQIWFSAGGVYKDENPYLLQYGHVNFDGSNQVMMTAGNGNHSISYSPDYKYIVDEYDRVDAAPMTELRRVSDGKLVTKLEEADVAEAKEASTYHPMEVFTAKARDGKTDIWGVISRPVDFDPAKKYPVIEYIYAGPQSFFTPKRFTGASGFAALNTLGFIVVQMDGMGTAGRSKAFHDVCWHDIKDAGFVDRIAWMKAAAAKYPYMDLDNVGIYGTSAGGQDAAAAVLFHPDFYKVAVANCGCHDNRIDKQTWNEQWMGYSPDVWSDSPDNWYAANSNVDNAYRLQGHLQLVVGDNDHNVPPESTFRVANALVQSGKDFDLLVVANADHGAASGITQRRLQDFFVRWLQHKEPPDRNMTEGTPQPPVARGRGAAGGRGARGARGGRGGANNDLRQRGGAAGGATAGM